MHSTFTELHHETEINPINSPYKVRKRKFPCTNIELGVVSSILLLFTRYPMLIPTMTQGIVNHYSLNTFS
jgi:hypothetical protein